MRLAKTAATLDVMSGGRLVLGVGVGLIEQELNAMGSPYKERGAITDETIAILKLLWTEEEPSHQGKRYQFSGMKFSPKPLQKPHIPLIIGGTSRAAIRRAARLGNGWHPTALAPAELSAAMAYLAQEAQAAGRVAADVPVSMSIPLQSGRAGRYELGTEPAEMIEKLRTFKHLGVDTVVVSPYTGDAQAMAHGLERLAHEVIPAVQTEDSP
jgi:probable F420-dependent oxidoreductase